jgi:hypothetical protein
MNSNLWKLHAAVFELARARGLGAFRVDTRAHAAGVVIELVMGAANDTSAPAPARARSVVADCSQRPAGHDA